MIICYPIGGLCNRIKCMLSCMRIDNDMKLKWEYKTYDGGVWCKFEDLFENKFEIVESSEYDYTDCKFLEFDNELNINHLDTKYGDNWGDHVPVDLKIKYLEQIDKLVPVKYVRDKINKYSKILSDKTITVSIRTWRDLPRTRETMGKEFNINKLFSIMDEYPDNNFLVTCDDQETFNLVIERYGDRILYTQKRTTFGDYHTAEGLQDALIDLYLGGKNKLLLSSYMSSYCEMQWWFGGCKSIVRVMILK